MNKLLAAVAVMVSSVSLLAGCTDPDSASPSRPGTGTAPPVSTQQPLMPFRPVVGGHLMVTADGSKVVMADVEADRLRIFSTSTTTLSSDVALPANSWPTRVIEGKSGELYVLLRGLGEVATVKNGLVASRTSVCREPRALTLDTDGNGLTVACAGGEVVHVVGTETQTTQTGVEWRDLQMTPTGLKGTSFRAAELVSLTPADLTIATRVKTPPQQLAPQATMPTLHSPQVAWRMVTAGAKTLLIHQLHANSLSVEVDAGFPNGTPNGSTGNNPYGGGPTNIPGQMIGCGNAAVVTAISTVEGGAVTSVLRTNDILPVDAALSPDGTQLAIVGAGGTGLSIYPLTSFSTSSTCAFATAGLTGLALNSVAWISNTKVVVLESLRASPMVFDVANPGTKSFGSDADRGSVAHALFHQAPRGGAPLACASCHPEGGEDGHTWIIDGHPRRTQTLAGGVMARAPFHWKGDLTDLDNLMGDTFVKRMGGTAPPESQITALGAWLDTIPAPKVSLVLNDDQLKVGLAAFNKAQCQTCHLSAGHQEGSAADIGTGERVRAPSLSGLAARAPYLHTGEIPDIRSRVTGGLHPNHGRLDLLNDAEREDLISYLQAL